MVTGQFGTVVLNVATPDFGRNSFLLAYRRALASDAVEHSERRAEVGSPSFLQLVGEIAEGTMCRTIFAFFPGFLDQGWLPPVSRCISAPGSHYQRAETI